MASQVYVLYEHASGYSLFYITEMEDVGALLPTVARGITDFGIFASTIKLISFSPFKSSTNALDNMNAVSEGILHDDLKIFLDTNVPKNKKGTVLLGIGDTRISATIQEETGIKCTTSEAITEVLRGIKLHFPHMVKGLTMQAEAKAQLGLSHSYSRAKVKFNVNRADNMIIQSIALLDQLDKDINTFSMRVKEWYSYHFPELSKISSDNYMYCRLAKLLGNRKNFPENIEEKLEEITMDSAKAQAIISASKMSMGMDVSPIDLINIESFCSRVISLSDYRNSLVKYLHGRMQSVAPNLSTLIGDIVSARLISHAGSLTNLAKYPASTVQILGAEKALFRALKSKGNTPKYGLIFHSTFIGRADSKNKGRISRYLANKCSIASRIDCFAEQLNPVFGEKLREQVEERLKFYESGEAPRKNVDVMKEASMESSALIQAQIVEEKAAKKKKKKKRKSEGDVDASQTETPKKIKAEEEEVQSLKTPKSGKKKKKAKDSEEVKPAEEEPVAAEATEEPKSEKKKKRKSKTQEEMDVSINTETPSKKKKKKKDALVEETEEAEVLVENGISKKKKKKSLNAAVAENGDVETPKSKKKKRKTAEI